MSGASRNRGPLAPYNEYPGTYRKNQLDGPGSGPGSASGSGGRRGSNAPSVASQHSLHSPTTSPRPPQGFPSTVGSASGSYGAPGATLLTDPAREYQRRPMDALRLMEMPATCFNFDNEVSQKFLHSIVSVGIAFQLWLIASSPHDISALSAYFNGALLLPFYPTSAMEDTSSLNSIH